ncbi:T9SS type A sorting domain-containing protein [Pontibacter sp. G13]|uniref:T9SS type A sorting domain-containing protein n=1 Tax=Pontibacter sp. G13 TaxID=3074898 RepID=UPI0028898C8A|nr:T9SS type A sorting domain-containing protein [Pontibacter sp. G13]WNJ19692.1 T9SS type A sorting domain-containing protein [Pontibacter sp. G13]
MRIFTILMALVCLAICTQAQVYTDHFDNDDPANMGGAAAYSFSESSSELTVTAASLSGPYDVFTYQMHDPGTGATQVVDASGNNKIFVRAKASAIGTQLRLDLEDAGNYATSLPGLTKTLTTEFQVLEFDFTDNYLDGGYGGTACNAGPCPVDSSQVAQLVFYANPGVGFAGSIVIDYVAFGAAPDTIITSDIFQDHFEDDSAANAFTFVAPGYALSQAGTELTITGDGTTGAYDPLTYVFMNLQTQDTFDIDITNNNKLFVKVKSSVAGTALRIDVQDIDGYASTAGSITKIVDTEYVVLEYDYSGSLSDLGYGGTPCTSSTAPCAVDGSRIADILLFIEPGVGAYLGDLTIDWISFGVSLDPPGPQADLIYQDHFSNETLEFTGAAAGLTVSEVGSDLVINGDGTSPAFNAISYLLHDKDSAEEIFLDMTPGQNKVFIRAKVDAGTVPLRIDLVDTLDFHTTQASLTKVVSDEWTVFEYDFSGNFTDAGYGGTACPTGPCPVDPTAIKQVLIFPDPIQGAFSGALTIDFLSVGQPAEEENSTPKGIVNYSDEMDDNTSLFISDMDGLTSTTSNGEWVISGDGTSEAYSPVVYDTHNDLGETELIDVVGSNNTLFIRAKASIDSTELRIDLQDYLDYVSNASGVSTLLSTEYEIYELDYTGAYNDGGYGGSPCTTGPCPVDGERIEHLQVFINAATGSFDGTVSIDWVSFGQAITGINQFDVLQTLRAFPNPTTDRVFVDYALTQSANVDIIISNLMGQQLMHQSLGLQAQGGQHTELDLSQLARGMYILQVWTDHDIAGTLRIVKQ